MSVPVLVVDDHPLNLKLSRLLLTSAGHEVRTAADAEEALEILKDYRPAIILMDLQLPGMDGFALTRLLKSNPATRPIVIVALTAYAMKGDEARAREAGCDGYIAKPIDTRRLADQVRGYLPPVSVWGTMTCNLKLRGFTWKQGINGFTTVVASSRVSVLCFRICLETPPTHFHQDNRRLAHLAFSVPPSQLHVVQEY